MLVEGKFFWPAHFWKTKWCHKKRYGDYRSRELSFCLRDFLWQQRRYRQSPSFSAAWSPKNPLAPGVVLQRPLAAMSYQALSSLVRNCPTMWGPTHPWPWLLGHLAFPPLAPSHPRPSIFSGRRQIWQLIVHFLWQTYEYSHVNRFVHISSCFHGNTRLRMKNPKLQFASGLLTACFPHGQRGRGGREGSCAG